MIRLLFYWEEMEKKIEVKGEQGTMKIVTGNISDCKHLRCL